MSRELTGHKVNPANDKLTVTAIDGPGPGGASHLYRIEGYTHVGAPAVSAVHLEFQNGPIAEVGVNGITHEALLEVLIDRLTGFESGPFANSYNATALEHLELARDALHARTKERTARGVEGTHAA